MNEKNLKYLKDNLKYMGFGEKLNADLENGLKEGKSEFQLKLNEKMFQGNMELNLHFKQSPSSDMYFFNSYEARLTKDNGHDMSQSFYLNNGKGVTYKEAYNLLDGRSVLKDLTNKEGEKYSAWIKLDFSKNATNNHFETRQFHAEKYGFNLVSELGKLDMVKLPEEKEKQLIQSLQKGNRQSVNFLKDGKETPMFIEANPQFKAINVYDTGGRQLSRFEKEQYLKAKPGNGLGQNGAVVKEPVVLLDQKQKGTGKAEKKSNDRTVKPSLAKVKNIKDLLPQKERASKKGLKIS
jgi:hypothetical protein